MDGKNSSPKDYISLIIVTIIYLFVLLATITFSDQKEHGKEEEKKHPQQSVVKSRPLVLPTPSKCGETESRPDPFCILTNVLKQLED